MSKMGFLSDIRFIELSFWVSDNLFCDLQRIPFELRVEGDKEPIYGYTLEDLGRFNEQPVLPFNAYGTMAMARSEFENNSASSQIFFLLKESELTPSSSNLLDGRYAVFGYAVDGQDYLGDMRVSLPCSLAPDEQ